MNPSVHTALAFLGTALFTYRVQTYYGSTPLLGLPQFFTLPPKGAVNRPSVQMQAEKHRLSCQLAEMVTCGVCRKQKSAHFTPLVLGSGFYVALEGVSSTPVQQLTLYLIRFLCFAM